MKNSNSPEFFEFFAPVKILSGRDSLDNLPYELTKKNSSNPLIITDEGIKKSGILKTVLKILRKGKITEEIVFTGTPQDSSLDVVKELSTSYRKNKCSSIIAIGGGSVIDTAKGVRILISGKTGDLAKLAGVNRISPSGIPLFVLPTTSGTGSEATQVAVISDNQKGEKMLFVSPHIYPDVAVIDPRLTLTLPPRLSAMTGMDALTHAVEAFTSLQKNPVSDAFAVSAVKMIFSSLVTAVRKPEDVEARLQLANASLLAGIAFSNSMVGAVHSIGHACGAVCHIPHGLAMSVILPHVMNFNLKKASKHYAELLLHAGGAELFSSTPPGERGKKMIELVTELRNRLEKFCGLPAYFSGCQIGDRQISEIAEYAINDGSILTNPCEMSVSEISGILRKCINIEMEYGN